MLESDMPALEQPVIESSTILPKKPAYKALRSTKDPGLKAAVIAKRMQSVSKHQIAKDLSIARNTVSVILNEANLEQQIESGRIGIGGLIPKAINVVDYRLGKNSETAAFKVLEGIGVLRSKSDVNINIASVSSNSWYQRRNGLGNATSVDPGEDVKQIDAAPSTDDTSNT